MAHRLVFVNRRRGNDRRFDQDENAQAKNDQNDNISVAEVVEPEEPHPKRRKRGDRRDKSKTLTDDYYAYIKKVIDTP